MATDRERAIERSRSYYRIGIRQVDAAVASGAMTPAQGLQAKQRLRANRERNARYLRKQGKATRKRSKSKKSLWDWLWGR